MTPYQVMIEGVFVHSPELQGRAGGFHTTFFINANNAVNAVDRARILLADRMHHHGVYSSSRGIQRTYFWVHDLWEISAERLSQDSGHDTGFTFFRIGRSERIYLALRCLFFQRFRPWLLVAPAAEPRLGMGSQDRA